MKLRRTKKGFTIVELVIVIAVIAVLSAVLIPTFISLNNKANKAADQSLIKNLETALATKAAEEGRNNTMYDALKDAEEAGYKIENLKSKEGKNLVWNQESDRFEIVANNQANYKLWKVYTEVPSTQTFSIYLNNTSLNSAVENLKVGFDVGENNSIPSISYVGNGADQEVIIRTNSYTTNLTVNTDGSVVHYGNMGKLAVEKVAMSSFHEFGNVRTVEITKGNFVIEESANVTLVSVVAAAAGDVKLDIQGDLEVLAGTNYEVTAGQADQTVNAPIQDDTYAIVNGVAKTDIQESYFADGNKVVLLKDYTGSAINLGSCEVVGNLTKLNAIASGDKVISLKNIHTTNIKLSGNKFDGRLTFDGGLLETSNPGTSDSNAAFYAGLGAGQYTFKNMTIAANITKGIKIASAKSVTIDNCEFDASKLNAYNSGVETDLRSLSLIDIQEQNKKTDGAGSKMTITITNNLFAHAPQGSITGGVADSDTGAAIKIKTEKAERSYGFDKVTVKGNNFVDCYRDVVVGCNVYQTTTSTKEQADMDAAGNEVKAPIWEVSGNKTTLTESVVSNRATLTYKASTASQSIAEKVGRIEGGCALWETFKSARSWSN